MDVFWLSRIPTDNPEFDLSLHEEQIGQNGKSMKKEYDFSKGKRGPIRSNKGKTRITIYLDDDILDAYRTKGEQVCRGYQTLINEALRETLNKKPALDAKTLRRILREELAKAE
jgi:uncharacterized protein (DUF4415 family)